MIRKNIYLTENQITQLNTSIANSGLSFAETVRRAVDYYLSLEKSSIICSCGTPKGYHEHDCISRLFHPNLPYTKQ